MGSILKIGNLMNAGDLKKGQADGFDIEGSFGRCGTTRDQNNKSIYKIILENLHKEDEEIIEKWPESFQNVKPAIKLPVSEVESTVNKILKEIQTNQSMFETLIKSVPDLEQVDFGRKVKIFFDELPTQTAIIEAKMKEVIETFAMILNFFMIGKNDAMRGKSEEFFKFWTPSALKLSRPCPRSIRKWQRSRQLKDETVARNRLPP